MATLNRITETIARFDHRGNAAVGRLARALTEAGLVHIGPRGSGAIHQDPESAANLLLGVACGEPPAGVARVVEAFGAASARALNWHAHGQDGCEAFDAIADAATLREAVRVALDMAPEVVHLAQERAIQRHPRSAEAAFDAAIRGLVIDVRVALFRPQGVACVRLVDSTDEHGPKNLALCWFDAGLLDAQPPGGSAMTITHEFGLALLAPVAFELRDRGNKRDREAGPHPSPPTGSTRAVARAKGHAAGPGVVHPEQRRETVQAADCARASHD